MSKASGSRHRGANARWLRCLAAAALLGAQGDGARSASPSAGPAVLQELREFCQLGTVLHVAAHPDDENTQLITYLARGRGYRTAYLSITRGDGGQNLLGPEFGELLGVIRTQELLAARRLDGGRQFFTRAIDFGFSKSDRETLEIWNRQQVLGDVVRVIRTFRPDVIVTRFSPQPSGTHGHHTASAVLAIDAFGLAGDLEAFTDQLDALDVWQPKRILENGGGRWRRGGDAEESPTAIRMSADGDDPVLGASFGEIAAQSRAMHKSQGFGNFGGFRGGGARTESFELLAGEPATNDIFDGIETTWRRYDGGGEVARLAETAVTGFNVDDLAANVPAILELRQRLAALPADSLVREKQKRLDEILAKCLGLTAETTIPGAEAAPGEPIAMRHRVSLQSGEPVRWAAVRYPATQAETAVGVDLAPGASAGLDAVERLPADALLTQPYWLREPGSVGMFRVDDASLIGVPENPPAFPCEFVFEVGGQTLIVPVEPFEAKPTEVNHDASGADESARRLTVVAPVAIEFSSGVQLFAPNGSSSVEVEIVAHRPNVAGALQLTAPAGWNVTPESQEWTLEKPGDRRRFAFQVTAPQRPETAELAAEATVGGVRYANSRFEIHYDHIPRQLLQPRARLKAVSLDLAIRGKRVGYVAGAGDDVAECLAQMGYEVVPLAGDDLTPERLADLDAVVIGIRALNTRSDLADRMPTLFEFVEQGGNVIVQYNRPDGLRVPAPAPYPLRLSGGRVTDENARIDRLAPDHPALNAPNKIVAADFDGWVQERGLYFPDEWDPAFTPLLACSDAGEAPLAGGVLVAQHGEGYFVYSSLAWFRQLPAGVPGAYRLFANLVSLGQ